MVGVVLVVENQSVPRDRRVWLEARSLHDAGLDVTVIGPKGSGHDTAAEEVVDGIRVRRFAAPASAGSVLGHLREYAVSAWRIAQLLWSERHDADIVHVANPPDFLLLLALPLRWTRGSRFIFDHHDLFPELFETRFGHRPIVHRLVLLLERASFALADAVVCTNESYRQIAITRGACQPERVFVVRNAPDASIFVRGESRQELRRGRRFLGVYVGVTGPQDGGEVALRALAHVKHELGRSDLHTAFIGDGDDVARCRQLALDLEIADIVEFTGWMETHLVVEYLSTADIALAPDPPNPLNDRSTMVKLVEYLAMGVPTVSFDLPESLVTAGDAAEFVRGGDIEGFARALVALLDDPARRSILSRAGMERSSGQLSWRVSQSALHECYRRVLARPLPCDLSARSTDAASAC